MYYTFQKCLYHLNHKLRNLYFDASCMNDVLYELLCNFLYFSKFIFGVKLPEDDANYAETCSSNIKLHLYV